MLDLDDINDFLPDSEYGQDSSESVDSKKSKKKKKRVSFLDARPWIILSLAITGIIIVSVLIITG
ncbi:MAG: hypothetical protein FD123_2283 [Bacteroidetes bacterium]|nr:MAG: hypothetical protein FD123_2283 [Bacteroidota bacterium]